MKVRLLDTCGFWKRFTPLQADPTCHRQKLSLLHPLGRRAHRRLGRLGPRREGREVGVPVARAGRREVGARRRRGLGRAAAGGEDWGGRGRKAAAEPPAPAPARLRGGAAPACVRRVEVLRPRGRSHLRPRGCGAEPLRRASTGAEQGGMEVGDGGRGRRGQEESWRKTRERKKDRNGTCVTSDRWVIFVTTSR